MISGGAAEGRHLPTSDVERARRSLNMVYLGMGFTVMAWVPRFPQVRDGLDVGTGLFGFLLSLGAVGAIVGTTLVGHAVHRFGTRTVLRAGIVATHAVLALIMLVHEPWAFGALNILFAACISAYVIGLNTQSVMIQSHIERSVVGRFHGHWSLGALLTGALSGWLAPLTTPAQHVMTLALLTIPVQVWLTRHLLTTDRIEHRSVEESAVPVPPFHRAPPRTWLLATAMACATLIEFSNGDWSTIYARDSLGAATGKDTLVFTSFTVAVLVSRFASDRVAQVMGVARMLRLGAGLVVLGVLIGSLGAYSLVSLDRELALIIACVGYAIAGAGTAPMVPVFTNAAAAVPGSPTSVTLARMGVAQQVIIWALKAVMAWIAGTIAIHIALLLPALTAVVVMLLAPRLVHVPRRPLVVA